MIPGVIAAQALRKHFVPVAGTGAVHFNGATSLFKSSISAADSPLCTIAFWAKSNWDGAIGTGENCVFSIQNSSSGPFYSFYGNNFSHPGGSFSAQFGIGAQAFAYNSAAGYSNTNWDQWVISTNTNFPYLLAVYINRVSHGTIHVPNSGVSFSISFSGRQLWIGDDGGGASQDQFVGDLADLGIWPGVSIVESGGTITSPHLDLFQTSGGNRVNPSVAIAALGTPLIMLTGNALAWPSNAFGNGGLLTVNAGALTDASTLPPGS